MRFWTKSLRYEPNCFGAVWHYVTMQFLQLLRIWSGPAPQQEALPTLPNALKSSFKTTPGKASERLPCEQKPQSSSGG